MTKKKNSKTGKKYVNLVLTLYGKVRELTGMVGNTMALDGGAVTMHKTAV